jgi:hypothetical protein
MIILIIFFIIAAFGIAVAISDSYDGSKEYAFKIIFGVAILFCVFWLFLILMFSL